MLVCCEGHDGELLLLLILPLLLLLLLLLFSLKETVALASLCSSLEDDFKCRTKTPCGLGRGDVTDCIFVQHVLLWRGPQILLSWQSQSLCLFPYENATNDGSRREVTKGGPRPFEPRAVWGNCLALGMEESF